MRDLNACLSQVEQLLGYSFKDKNLLIQAFTHRSYYNENRDVVRAHNERLEFLGDSILGFVVSDYLYHRLPFGAEGELSRMRAHLVEASSCVRFLLQLELAPFVLLGKGERLNEGRGRETILADLFEAILGAVYLDAGIVGVRDLFWTHFEKEVQERVSTPARNWKAELQDYSQKKYQQPPSYVVLSEEGPCHKKIFHVAVFLGGQEMGCGSGSSKKEAEQAAAQSGVENLLNG